MSCGLTSKSDRSSYRWFLNSEEVPVSGHTVDEYRPESCKVPHMRSAQLVSDCLELQSYIVVFEVGGQRKRYLLSGKPPTWGISLGPSMEHGGNVRKEAVACLEPE